MRAPTMRIRTARCMSRLSFVMCGRTSRLGLGESSLLCGVIGVRQMVVDLTTNFEQFLVNISLGDPQVPRMNSAARTVSDFLMRSYGISASNVFLQGSYANGTAVEPVPGGEYDVDLVAICADGQSSAD